MAAVRIARRDAWRAKGRSLLVLAMIALPVIGVSAANITYRSSQLTPQDKLERVLGDADALLTDAGVGGEALFQDPQNERNSVAREIGDDDEYPSGSTDVRKALPAGATALSSTLGGGKLSTKHGLLSASIRELKAADPMVAGMMPLVDGRFPKTADEVAATTFFLENSGLKVGSTLKARHLDREYTIVGSYELPSALKTNEVNALPGALIAPLDRAMRAAGLPVGTEPSTSYLVKIDGGFTWNHVQAVNKKGVLATSRSVILSPPPDSEIPLYAKDGKPSAEQYTDEVALTIAATVMLLALLEICLLAGPAFAVGARRSRRQLGLVGANGGDRRHIRAIVLSGGLVIGLAAAVVGTVLGIALTLVARPWLEEYVGERFGSFQMRPTELLAIALLAVGTGLAAALLPAVNASRQPVLDSLTGRQGIRRSNRVLPLVGLVAVVAGAAIALFGFMIFEEFLLIAAGSVIAELGVVAMTPALVGMFGRIGRFLPLAPRLALRDAVRNRGRTAPAVAAVLAAVAGTVAVATYAASSEAADRAEYTASLPHGSVAVTLLAEGSSRHAAAVRDAVQKEFPVTVRADMDRIAVGNPNCSIHGSGAPDAGCGRYELITPPANECPLDKVDPARPDEEPAAKFSPAERNKMRQEDWRCEEGPSAYVDADVVIGDAKLLKVLRIEDPAAEKALNAGKPLVFDRAHLDTKGSIGIRLITDIEAADKAREEYRDPPGRIVTLPAHRMGDKAEAYGIRVIMPAATAKAEKIDTTGYGAYYALDRLPRTEEEQRLDKSLSTIGADERLFVEKGFQSETKVMMLALALFAGLVTIGAAGIATGLSQADAEADLRTLAAVGAPAGVRRTLSAFQCGVVAAMGVVLGSVAGALPALGLVLSERHRAMTEWEKAVDLGYSTLADKPYFPIEVPWPTLAVLLIAVPVGAALLAAVVTRSRGALSRRAAA
ncbi:ABC transporter permease [Streptomyces yaizuensis]|uniref:ABC transporter permease n=1 Tax=Streptomyces yaizuensis TaxID=2989713 RepID=A0ABQ5P235_9ACTN|nr:ABC transporter permease [Streptomyces sp. YSPA8]